MKIPLTPDSILNTREAITKREFHDAFGYPIDTIEWWLKTRKLDYIKGNPKRIFTSSIKKFIESRTVNVKATNIIEVNGKHYREGK